MNEDAQGTNHIVCYLDLLGYTHLVKDHADDLEKIRGIQRVFEGAVGMIDGFKTMPEKFSTFEEHRKLAHRISLRISSDSTIFSMPLLGLSRLRSEIDIETNTFAYLSGFLDKISMFCLFVTGKLAHLYRGGIAIGQHYEDALNNNPGYQFIFSKAMVEAYEIERSATYPRIVFGEGVDANFKKMLTEAGYLFLDPTDNKLCLDIYGRLDATKEGAQKVLREICEGIPKAIRYYRHNHPQEFFDRMRSKYEWWIACHNLRTKELGFPADIQINAQI